MDYNNSWNNSCNGCGYEDCRQQNGCGCNNCNCGNGNSGSGSNIWVPIIAIALLGGLFGGGNNNQCR